LADAGTPGAYEAGDEGLFFASTDDTGNITNTNMQTIDAPIITDATTADTDMDGKIDRLTLTFEEPMTVIDGDATDGIPGLTIAETGWSIAAKDYAAVGVLTLDLDIITDVVDTAQTLNPVWTFSSPSPIQDADGHNLSTADTESTTDGAAPVLLYAAIDNADSDAETPPMSYVNATFSEAVDTDGDPAISMSINGSVVDITAEQDGVPNNEVYEIAMNSVVQTATDNITSITVTDLNGNSAVLYLGSDVGISAFRRTLSAGFNYVSFPIADYHQENIGAYFSDTTLVDSVWTYANGTWTNYDPDIDPVDKFTIQGGYGYIVDIADGQSLTLAPRVYNIATGEGSLGAPMERPVSAGWNLIGHYQEFNQTVTTAQAFATITTGVNFDQNVVYSFETTGLLATGTLTTGYAYWAFADASGTYAEGSTAGD